MKPFIFLLSNGPDKTEWTKRNEHVRMMKGGNFTNVFIFFWFPASMYAREMMRPTPHEWAIKHAKKALAVGRQDYLIIRN